MTKKVLSIIMCALLLGAPLSGALADDDFPPAGSSLAGEEALISAVPGSLNSLTGWKETEAYQTLEREYGSDNVSALLEEGFRDDIASSISAVLDMFGATQTTYDTTDPAAGYAPISFTSVTEIPPEYLLLIETLIQQYSAEEQALLQEWESLRDELLHRAEKLDDELQARYEQLIQELIERIRRVRDHQKRIKEMMDAIVGGRRTPFRPYTLADIEAYLSRLPQEDPGPQCVVEIDYRIRKWTSVGGGEVYLPGPAPTPAAPGGAEPTPGMGGIPSWENKKYVTTLSEDQVSGIRNVPKIESEDTLPRGYNCLFPCIGGRYVSNSVYVKVGNRTPNSLDDMIMRTIESFKGADKYVDVRITAIYIIYRSDAGVAEDTYTMQMYTQTAIPPPSDSGTWQDSCTVRVQRKKEYHDYFKNFEKEMQETVDEANRLMDMLRGTLGWDNYQPSAGIDPGAGGMWADDLAAVQSLHGYFGGTNNEFKSSKDQAISKFREFASRNAGRRLLNEVAFRGVTGMTAEELITKLTQKFPRQYIAIQDWFKQLEKELEAARGFTDEHGITYDAASAKQMMALRQLLFFASFRDTVSVYEIVEATVTDVSTSVIMSQTPTTFSATNSKYNWGIMSPTSGRTWQNVKRTALPQLKHRFYTPGKYCVICTQNIMYEVVSAMTVSFRGSICIKGADGNLKTLYTWEKTGHMNETLDCKDDPGARDTDRCVAYYNFNFWTSEERGEIDEFTGTIGKPVWQDLWTVTGEENPLSGLDQEFTTRRVD